MDNDSLHIAESFVKDDVYLTNFKVLSSTSTTDICMYKNPTENIAYSISPNSKRVDAFDIDNSGALFAVNLIHSLSTEFKYSSFVEKFIYITKIKSITNTSCHGSSCYFIDFYDGSQLWIEKDTGLTLRSTAPSLPRIQDYEYKLNITDEITVPDITGYTINYN